MFSCGIFFLRFFSVFSLYEKKENYCFFLFSVILGTYDLFFLLTKLLVLVMLFATAKQHNQNQVFCIFSPSWNKPVKAVLPVSMSLRVVWYGFLLKHALCPLFGLPVAFSWGVEPAGCDSLKMHALGGRPPCHSWA